MNALIEKYFPNLTDLQKDKIKELKPLYEEWNEKINIISRKDMDGFYEKHVLHSLGIAKIISFASATKILDIGTGGGFPGIPLAILFPDSDFLLVDSIGKKINVVQEVARNLNLKNVKAVQARAENINEKFDFVVSRAVTQMPIFMTWVKGKFLKTNNNSLKNGVLYLKGGDLSEELKSFKKAEIYQLNDFFGEDFFETKKLVYLPN
ncbi:MAG: 16S rRNA (guanine(527)-N(7))-methyltransferase RsmG [Flavobacteriaceae bacterium]|jgi:16S rRNA (guanine527-N7)-methyltransferase|nr:16S rRNA (guanine(527)-N(7))-methyltransferase RsmG [Flavobacteriaceae bacterium]